ncbi:MAG: hypothetical protein K2G53_09595 [Muribaculaceae bacterium]|nr:hypothetical protein [Bacteroidales bacterium]MBD5303324.1 hypothetical protein [Bacteroides sp.]MBD5340654.1 hypothetical protein [Bacteroides sp.]MDE6072785.1 hypothetical protein [Muribaculaceae bacterium]
MSKNIKKLSFWMRRKSHLTLIAIGTVVVLLLFFNEETSLRLNLEYQEQIKTLKRQIRECEDSAAWYRARREALYINTEDLEHLVREQYHMQRPTEDVYVIK